MAEHASQAVTGYGTQVQYGDGATPIEKFENFHEVVSCEPPDEQTDEIEVTHFESPDAYKEFIRGLRDAGSWKFKLNWRPDLYVDHQQLVTDEAAGTKRNYQIVLPGAMDTITTLGFVKGMKPSLDPKGAVQMEITIRSSAVSHDLPVIS